MSNKGPRGRGRLGGGAAQANTFPVQRTQEPVSNELNSMGSSKAKTEICSEERRR